MAKINSVEANTRENGKRREEPEPPNSKEQLPKLLTEGVGGAGDDGSDGGGSSNGLVQSQEKTNLVNEGSYMLATCPGTTEKWNH